MVGPYPGPTHFLLVSGRFILIQDANTWDPGIKFFAFNIFTDCDRSMKSAKKKSTTKINKLSSMKERTVTLVV